MRFTAGDSAHIDTVGDVICAQLKKVLSSIPEAPMNVECLMNDIDFRSSMTREQFEELAQPVLQRARAPLATVSAHRAFSCFLRS